MAVRHASVTDVTSKAAVPSNLLSTVLLASLLGGTTAGFGTNTLAALLALTGGANLAVSIPFSPFGSVLGQPVISVLPNTAAASTSAALAALLGAPALALANLAVPSSSGLLSTLALFSLLGTTPSCAF
ncbi:MAG: hypothetical protein ACM3ZA_01265 [Bacillota bacterium]